MPAPAPVAPPNNLAEMALATINDGVIITDASGVIEFINPAAITMTGCGAAENAIGFDYALILKLESKNGRTLSEAENQLVQSMRTSQALDGYEACLIAGASSKRIPIAISMVPSASAKRIITFRNITRELAEESEQAEFISTASHEMRTPVASIEGYLSLALNSQTATIDDRARGYLDAAHKASKHLGHLFQDLLDTTNLDDDRIRPQLVPVELDTLLKQICQEFLPALQNAGLAFQFGTPDATASGHQLSQVIYSFVDPNFLHEIIGNLLENAIKYTKSGGTISVSTRGDGDRVIISVKDTGIGISSNDIGHVFQKFYRADNSDTRTIGGTGLGLYLVKQRTEAMGGRVWAESMFGQGSTFYVSLPRLTPEEYEKRMIAVNNANMIKNAPRT